MDKVFVIKTRYYHHPESCCVWPVPECTAAEHDAQFADGCVNEISFDDYIRIKREYADMAEG